MRMPSQAVTGALLLASLLTPSVGLADTYWVSPTGQAAWSACRSDTPLEGTAACPLRLANLSAVAGDLVYLRGGVYSLASANDGGIDPRNSGTCPNPPCLGGRGATFIEFAAFAGEVPVLAQANPTTPIIGLRLYGDKWVRVTGITFKNFTHYMGFLYGGASYNEISYCSFVSEPGYDVGMGFIVGGFDGSSGWSTHNWIHHNFFSRRRAENPCGEAVDVIRLGNNVTNPWSADNHNTFESNLVEHGSHSTLVTNSLKNVIINNTFHNEPWVPGCSSWRKATSRSTLTLGTGSRTLVTQPGITGFTAGQPISIVSEHDLSQAMSGVVTNYNTTGGTLTVDVRHASGSGTSSSWLLSQGNIPKYSDSTYDGKYGHRNLAIGDENHYVDNLNLVEGNRIGFAGVNPGNGGSTNLDFESPGNIGRYNFIYGGMTSGVYFKWPNSSSFGDGTGGVRNYVYSNTIYRNGLGWDAGLYGGANLAYNGQGIAQLNYSRTVDSANVMKNNIVVGNSQGDICEIGWYGGPGCAPAAYDAVESNWVSTSGDPRFANPDLSNPASQSLFASLPGFTPVALPDLRLRASSPAIDGASSLTRARGAGTRATKLVVEDARYFQDGTRGSDLARTVSFFADWIAIGSITNVSQVLSVDYATGTLTLATPSDWTDAAEVWLFKKADGKRVLMGAAPDFGADEFGSVNPPGNVKITR